MKKWDGGLSYEGRTEDVSVKDALQLVAGGPFGVRGLGADTGIVDQDVETPEGLGDGGECGRDGGVGCYVELDEGGGAGVV